MFLFRWFFAKSMNEMALSASNIYIVSASVKYSNRHWLSVGQFVATHILLVAR